MLTLKEKSLGFLVGFLSTLSLFFIYTTPNIYTFFLVIALWWLFLILLSKRHRVHSHNIVLEICVSIAFLILICLVEGGLVPWFLMFACGIISAVVWYWSLLYKHQVIIFKLKPLRRVIVAVWTFVVYTWHTALYAIATFFQFIPFWILSILGAVVSGLVAYMIWSLYYRGKINKWLVWMIITSLITIELLWVLNTLPFGYFVLGLFVTWIWYLVQLFIRFHISPRGIIWKRQKWFLLSNAVLLVAILFIVRWI